jgi:hypothetical protein
MPHEVDAAAEGFGMRMGPIRMTDLVGIDLFGRERAKRGEATPDTNLHDWMYANTRCVTITSQLGDFVTVVLHFNDSVTLARVLGEQGGVYTSAGSNINFE